MGGLTSFWAQFGSGPAHRPLALALGPVKTRVGHVALSGWPGGGTGDTAQLVLHVPRRRPRLSTWCVPIGRRQIPSGRGAHGEWAWDTSRDPAILGVARRRREWVLRVRAPHYANSGARNIPLYPKLFFFSSFSYK